jgi:hypothetical protein
MHLTNTVDCSLYTKKLRPEASGKKKRGAAASALRGVCVACAGRGLGPCPWRGVAWRRGTTIWDSASLPGGENVREVLYKLIKFNFGTRYTTDRALMAYEACTVVPFSFFSQQSHTSQL